MNHPTYNYHHTNPYYRPDLSPFFNGTGWSCYDFATAMAESYAALNARLRLPEITCIGTVAARIANEEAEIAYEKQLVRISQPFIPSQGPPFGTTLCQMFADERGPVEITDSGGIQYKLPLRDTD